MLTIVALAGLAVFIVGILRLVRDPFPAPPPRRIPGPRPEPVDGCFGCLLASTAGDDVLFRHRRGYHGL